MLYQDRDHLPAKPRLENLPGLPLGQQVIEEERAGTDVLNVTDRAGKCAGMQEVREAALAVDSDRIAFGILHRASGQLTYPA